MGTTGVCAGAAGLYAGHTRCKSPGGWRAFEHCLEMVVFCVLHTSSACFASRRKWMSRSKGGMARGTGSGGQSIIHGFIVFWAASKRRWCHHGLLQCNGAATYVMQQRGGWKRTSQNSSVSKAAHFFLRFVIFDVASSMQKCYAELARMQQLYHLHLPRCPPRPAAPPRAAGSRAAPRPFSPRRRTSRSSLRRR